MSPDLSLLVRAGHPVIAIESTDEDRALAMIAAKGPPKPSGPKRGAAKAGPAAIIAIATAEISRFIECPSCCGGL